MQAQVQTQELQLPRDSRANALQRKDPMTRIVVKSRTENQLIPGGYLVPRGVSTMLVYSPDLPVIQAMVETEPEALKRAEDYFIKEVESSIADELKALTDPEAKANRLTVARLEYSGSVEAKFRELERRDLKPLLSVEVLEENIPAPVQAQQHEQQSFLAATIAREVAAALAAALPAVIAAAVQGQASQTAKRS